MRCLSRRYSRILGGKIDFSSRTPLRERKRGLAGGEDWIRTHSCVSTDDRALLAGKVRISPVSGKRRDQTGESGDCTVQDRQCETKYQFVFFRVRIASLGEGPIRRDFTVSAHTDLSVDKTGQED